MGEEEFFKLSKETYKCNKRLIEIDYILKVPECGSKNELWREMDELVEKIHKLNLKLCTMEAKEAFNTMLKIRNDTLAYEELMARKRDKSEKT